MSFMTLQTFYLADNKNKCKNAPKGINTTNTDDQKRLF